MIKHLLPLVLIPALAFAQSGGHTGNGGGVVECPGKAPIVLDYYEALQKGHKLIDLEKISRNDFFDLMIMRLKLGGSTEPKGWTGFVSNFIGSNMPGGMVEYDLHRSLAEALKKQKSLDQWPEISSWRVKDEFVDDNLPQGCTFQQAAISVIGSTGAAYRIRSVTDRLSRGQILLLELHEYLNQSNAIGTTLSIRELVGTLIRKRVNYPIMRIAHQRFFDPSRDYTWKWGSLRAVSFPGAPKEETYNPGFGWSAYDPSGLFALDLRGKADLERKTFSHCPHWIGILPLSKGNYVMQLFRDSGKDGEAISEDLVLPRDRVDLLQKTIVAKYMEGFYERGILDPQTQNIRRDIRISHRNAKTSSNNELIFQRADQAECPYVEVNHELPEVVKRPQTMHQLKRAMQDELFPSTAYMAGTVFQQSYYVKQVRAYYEERRLGLTSRFEPEMERLRTYFGW